MASLPLSLQRSISVSRRDALLAAGASASALRINMGVSPADYMTVLHSLATENSATMLKRVLATGVLDLDVRAGPDRYNWTPLHEAASCDAARAVAALLAASASLATTDSDGDDALQLAIHFSSHKAARLLLEATSPAGRSRYKRAAIQRLADCRSAAKRRPRHAGAAAKLAAARAVAALFV